MSLSFFLLHSESFFLSINTIRITMAQQCRSFILLSIHSHWLSSFIQPNLESSLIFSLLWITSAAKQTESHIPSPSLSICLIWPECLLLIKKSTYPFWNWLIIRSDLTSFLSNWVCLSLMSFFLSAVSWSDLNCHSASASSSSPTWSSYILLII